MCIGLGIFYPAAVYTIKVMAAPAFLDNQLTRGGVKPYPVSPIMPLN